MKEEFGGGKFQKGGKKAPNLGSYSPDGRKF